MQGQGESKRRKEFVVWWLRVGSTAAVACSPRTASPSTELYSWLGGSGPWLAVCCKSPIVKTDMESTLGTPFISTLALWASVFISETE